MMPIIRCRTISHPHAPARAARAAGAFPAGFHGTSIPAHWRAYRAAVSQRCLAREGRARRASAGRLDTADSIYREILTLAPTNSQALHYFGVLHYQRGQHADAAALMSHALKYDRHDAACWSNRGLAAAALGHLDEATICYDQALQLQPDFADARNNFGVALQAQGALNEAVEQYRLAITSNPALVDAYLNLGTALGKLGRFAEALACYRDALRVDPASAEAHFNTGNAHNAQGEHEAAVASFERALALRPDYARRTSTWVARSASVATMRARSRTTVARLQSRRIRPTSVPGRLARRAGKARRRGDVLSRGARPRSALRRRPSEPCVAAAQARRFQAGLDRVCAALA